MNFINIISNEFQIYKLNVFSNLIHLIQIQPYVSHTGIITNLSTIWYAQLCNCKFNLYLQSPPIYIDGHMYNFVVFYTSLNWILIQTKIPLWAVEISTFSINFPTLHSIFPIKLPCVPKFSKQCYCNVFDLPVRSSFSSCVPRGTKQLSMFSMVCRDLGCVDGALSCCFVRMMNAEDEIIVKTGRKRVCR